MENKAALTLGLAGVGGDQGKLPIALEVKTTIASDASAVPVQDFFDNVDVTVESNYKINEKTLHYPGSRESKAAQVLLVSTEWGEDRGTFLTRIR